MDLIGETNPHWIRCIKPHPDKKPRMFYGREVMGQLESSGVLATVKLRKAGYPVRIPRALFCRNYRMCTSVVTKDEKEFIQHVLQMAQIRMPSLAQIGKTKVFLKAEGFKLLERLRDRHLLCTSLIIQRIARGYLTRRGVYDIFLLFHKVEIARKNLDKASKDMHLQEADLRHSYELEEDTSWKLIKELEAESRVYQETIETAERERRRKAIEDERRRVEEARRIEELRRRAAICIQRHVRGELVRIRLYRQLLEERRASLEYERELACGAERREARALDAQRITDEKSWTQWLSSMDYLRGKKRQEEQRLLEKKLQKTRIQIRELVRKEDRMRLNIEVEQTDAFFELFSQHQYISSHYMKVAAERRRRMEKLQLKTPVVLRPQSAGMKARANRSAAADARINRAITDFALSRARSYEEKRESQSLVSHQIVSHPTHRRKVPFLVTCKEIGFDSRNG
ncbi:putative myosin heavy chain MYA2-related [Trypanosoma cruzi]|uniref:Putative myosin heavy chain MYA2-related n=1 Tax=Trypanosoma cruzi TaxID=5693 RepID=A0A2V2W888_TRYCR|nr:putative myosin heavy chain MYA2-related [Trypanosoma cruzi]